MELKIGRDTLLAISAIAWADGSMDAKEADALRHAARQLQIQAQLCAALNRHTS